MTAAIEVTHLQKAYGSFPAVRDISFTVEPGEVFCLLGPNGAGKTTTTEILEGYRTRTAGDVRVLGFDPGRGERALRQRVGIVLQECGVQEDLSVAEVFAMYAAYYPRPMAVADVVELVELDAKADTLVRHLSGGQRRRLDVGLALIGDPDLIFLDEPTTGFDPAARRQSWATFRRLSELGKTVLLTTHFMDEAEALADHIAVVAAGTVIAEGTPTDLGGRARATATITASLPSPSDRHDLPDLGPATVTFDGDQLQVTTDDAARVVHRLTGWAIEHGVSLDDLVISRPTLEDVYLALTASITDPRTALTKESVR